MEDKELLKLVKEPSTQQQAFKAIVEKYQRKVYWLVRKMVVDHDDADDITQEVFIKVWNALPTFRGDSQLYTWIYRIAGNESINFLNKKKRRYFMPIHDYENELVQKLESDVTVDADEIVLKLQKAVLQLPEKQRLVFNLKYYDELKYEEISEVVGTSVGALKASYHIAVKKIEEYISTN